MKLNTKKLFSQTKLTKPSKKSNKKVIICTPSTSAKSNNNNNTEKEKLLSKIKSSKNNNIFSQKINPFILDPIEPSKQKNNNNIYNQKSVSSKNNNIFLSNNEENIITSNINKETDKDKKNQDFETLCNLFQKSEFKSTIIMDNNGNNNLNLEQKKFINDYFDKKEKIQKNINECKIQNIKVQSYNRNNILLKDKLNSKTIDNVKSTNKRIFKKRQMTNKVKNNFNKYLSSTNNIKIDARKLFLDDINNENLEFDIDTSSNEKNEGNSLFENCTGRSFDSSFLGSSMADEFFEIL